MTIEIRYDTIDIHHQKLQVDCSTLWPLFAPWKFACLSMTGRVIPVLVPNPPPTVGTLGTLGWKI